ncbi:WD repeat-containing protein 6 [Cocos nucifera]|uniref:WD repeat-containing protein 6 n=1 Tax=Cocos nucifera TaxID=13894 RepID=A0A8K0HSH4_COCNU|nr:WD repeat-containing protein 6 [Cocos nucifera]
MSNVVSRVKSSERCLLYSMRMWGDSMKTLRVASGTIFNEIIIWKLIPHAPLPFSKSAKESYNHSLLGYTKTWLPDQQYMAMHLSRLTGHEGSIFRITWSADGSKLMSVSDDRSARVWMVSDQRQDSGDLGEIPDHYIAANLTLFGHNARIWDCYISDSIVITAGEDCTCRLWGMDGNQLMMFKEHIGRGIWRCQYDPSSSLLVTGGFDSAIKVHQLHFSSYGEAAKHNVVSYESKDQTEIFQIYAPKVSKHIGLMDSPWDVRWTELAQVSEDAPIICMDIMVMNSSEHSLDKEDIVAVGDGKGDVTVVRLINDDATPRMAFSFTWSAEKERQLLGVYWCKSLGCSHLFTADPRGTLKLWKIKDALLSDTHDTTADPKVFLIAAYTSCFGARIMCINASVEEEVLICGDKRGNVTVFPLSESLMASKCSETVEIPVINCFKGAHGIYSVTSIYIGTPNLDHVEIRTTGGDGCICNFKYDKNLQELEFIGMKQVKELSIVQSVVTKSNCEDLVPGSYTIGFTSVDFIMWDLTNETKTIQIPCGGWRRPYSYHLGAVPEYQNCFAYLKDHTIHIHRLWLSCVDGKLFPRILHMQSHGREMHSLHFIFPELWSNPMGSRYLWVATGCEDGTVRLTRYTPFGMGSWCESKLLGEHVGGSAVRSLCFIPNIYAFRCGTYNGSGKCTCHPSIPRKDDQFLLISVGSKQVLTSWLFRNETPGREVENLNGILAESECMPIPSKQDFPSISFQWLSTHMPPKVSSSQRRVEKLMEIFEKEKSSTKESIPFCRSHSAENRKEVKSAFIDQTENDWRYLAVTAFHVKHTDSRLTVCFVVVACSDATLMLQALLLPHRMWFDVALLVPQTSPVLALQHIVVAGCPYSEDDAHNRNAYIVISGSTDGSIAFWDLTEIVECFMQLVSEIQPQMLFDSQRRPQTGRGSQGGRWWKSMITQYSKKGVQHGLSRIKDSNDVNGPTPDKTPNNGSSVQESDPAKSQTSCRQTMGNCHMPERVSNMLASEIREVRPFHVLNSVHQSGVNCLYMSEMQDCFHSRSEGAYCVLSGGDDQAVHCVCFKLEVHLTDLAPKPGDPANQGGAVQQPLGSNFTWKCSHLSLNDETQLKILSQNTVASAHSSAVKGIWTDGIWAFSTGLDQRIRCWQIDHCGKLTEHAHLIISVPEPETMDAMVCDSTRNRYQIAVGGRGMQMVEFYASDKEDE